MKGRRNGIAINQDCGRVIADAPTDSVLVLQALSEGRYAYALVNNRFERNAPMTVQGLSERLRAEVLC